METKNPSKLIEVLKIANSKFGHSSRLLLHDKDKTNTVFHGQSNVYRRFITMARLLDIPKYFKRYCHHQHNVMGRNFTNGNKRYKATTWRIFRYSINVADKRYYLQLARSVCEYLRLFFVKAINMLSGILNKILGYIIIVHDSIC